MPLGPKALVCGAVGVAEIHDFLYSWRILWPESTQPAAWLKSLEAQSGGGVSVVMNHPTANLEPVANICAVARNSNAPNHALYGLLNSSQLFETSPALQNGRFSWEGLEPRDVEHFGRALMAAVSYVQTLWGLASNDQEFTCVLSVARPEGDMRLDLNIDRPGLVFHFGSILAALAKGPLSVAGWSLALFSGRGVGGW